VRAVVFTRYGGPEVLDVAELQDPEPGLGEVRVRAFASTVNPSDVLFRSGAIAPAIEGNPPWIAGQEAAGVVDAAGEGTKFQVGDNVVVYTPFIPTGRGGHAQLVVRPEAAVAQAPRAATFAEAATLPMNGLTTLRALDLLGLKPGETLAVTGAAGAVGGYAVQLAAGAGVRTVAVVAPEDEQLVRDLGADMVVARGERFAEGIRALVPAGVDAAVDAALVGDSLFPAVRDGGTIAAVRGVPPEEVPRGIQVVRVSVRDYYLHQDKLVELVELVNGGRLSLRVAACFPPERAADAYRAMEAGGVRGRLIVAFEQ
jgi:NADPH:quinone reductase-like Zn-dependent oxidoreductase